MNSINPLGLAVGTHVVATAQDVQPLSTLILRIQNALVVHNSKEWQAWRWTLERDRWAHITAGLASLLLTLLLVPFATATTPTIDVGAYMLDSAFVVQCGAGLIALVLGGWTVGNLLWDRYAHIPSRWGTTACMAQQVLRAQIERSTSAQLQEWKQNQLLMQCAHIRTLLKTQLIETEKMSHLDFLSWENHQKEAAALDHCSFPIILDAKPAC